jgi:hypothetical protein
MINGIAALVQQQAKTAARRALTPVAFALIGGLFVLFALAGLFAALFFWLEPDHGPIAASLICTAVAIVLALIAFLPLMFRRRPPPSQLDGTFPQVASLIAKTVPKLGPRDIIVTAALLGVALIFSTRGTKK